MMGQRRPQFFFLLLAERCFEDRPFIAGEVRQQLVLVSIPDQQKNRGSAWLDRAAQILDELIGNTIVAQEAKLTGSP